MHRCMFEKLSTLVTLYIARYTNHVVEVLYINNNNGQS